MRASKTEGIAVSASNVDNNNDIDIDPSATLCISLTISTSPRTVPRHTPILLPSGVISISPLYLSHMPSKPEFIPHRPTFPSTASSHAPSLKDKAKSHRHAALIAHLSAELREDDGSWENMVRECKKGRGGYQRSR